MHPNHVNPKDHVREIFFVGLLVGAIYAFDEVISLFVLPLLYNSNVSQIWISYVNYLVLPFVSFILAPCLLFVIIYIWAKQRLTTNFRENYSTLILFLFFGSMTGFIFTYFPLVFVAGDTFNIPNLPSLVVGVFQYVQSIISMSVSVVLTGFAALTISYFKSERRSTSNEKIFDSSKKILPMEYPEAS